MDFELYYYITLLRKPYYMKTFLSVIILLFTAHICSADRWTRKADFPGAARTGAYGFTIGNKAYVGAGLGPHGLWTDLWEYNSASDTWIQKADQPFIPLREVGFAIGDYGYVFTSDSVNRFWQYDPIADSWIRKADIPGAYRVYPAYFVIGNKAYLGGGWINGSSIADNHFYSYDPATNSWTSIADMPDSFYQARGFSDNSKGYITGIVATSYVMSNKLLEYDPSTNSWSRKADFPDTARADATAFTIENKGYFGVGDNTNGTVRKDWWQYNTQTDVWTKKTSIPCVEGKDENTAFVVNYKGYICFGNDASNNSEVWEYGADSVTAVEQLTSQIFQINIYPNPTTSALTITTSNKINTVAVYSLIGQALSSYEFNALTVQIDVSDLPTGMYLIRINDTEVRRFVKQ